MLEAVAEQPAIAMLAVAQSEAAVEDTQRTGAQHRGRPRAGARVSALSAQLAGEGVAEAAAVRGDAESFAVAAARDAEVLAHGAELE